MSGWVVLYYDEFHTPLTLIAPRLDSLGGATLIDVRLDDVQLPPPDVTGWPVVRVDARDRFSEGYLLPAVKANAVYQGGYFLSAALSRPLLAEVCAGVVEETRASTLLHGLAGNDQVRFEMAMQALAPKVTLTSVAALLGSQNRRNGDRFTCSFNLWGRSIEAGELSDPAAPAPAELWQQFGATVAEGVEPALHTVRFDHGRPVAVDEHEGELHEVISTIDAVGRRHGVGFTDLIEDGSVGLKTRAIYHAPAAMALVTAHQDLERLVSTREQNRFKSLVDQAWTNLVYDGFWFDAQRTSLEAYIDDVNQWVTGEVTLRFATGAVQAVARCSEHGLYDEEQAVYRFGQDFAAADPAVVASARSPHMRAVVRRQRAGRDRAGTR